MSAAALLTLERPWVVAHRGASTTHPENTHAAFEAAVLSRADMIELDVGWTRDGVPVALHDEDLDRTTDGRGPLAAHAYDEVASLSAGRWFGETFAAERVPRLEDVLRRYAPQIPLDLELKHAGGVSSGTLVEGFVDLLTRTSATAHVMVSSFEPSWLRPLADALPEVPRLLLVRGRVGRRERRRADELGATLWGGPIRAMTRGAMRRMGARRALAYTVNDRVTARRLFARGVGGIFTDVPAAFTA